MELKVLRIKMKSNNYLFMATVLWSQRILTPIFHIIHFNIETSAKQKSKV